MRFKIKKKETGNKSGNESFKEYKKKKNQLQS